MTTSSAVARLLRPSYLTGRDGRRLAEPLSGESGDAANACRPRPAGRPRSPRPRATPRTASVAPVATSASSLHTIRFPAPRSRWKMRVLSPPFSPSHSTNGASSLPTVERGAGRWWSCGTTSRCRSAADLARRTGHGRPRLVLCKRGISFGHPRALTIASTPRRIGFSTFSSSRRASRRTSAAANRLQERPLRCLVT